MSCDTITQVQSGQKHVKSEKYGSKVLEKSRHRNCLYSKQMYYREAKIKGTRGSIEWKKIKCEASKGVWVSVFQGDT